MDRDQLRQGIKEIGDTIAADTPTSATEAKFQGVTLIALALVGELLIDIKRIADAMEAINNGLHK